MSEPVTGLREAKKNATRRALTTAARELVLELGLDEVSVQMICARAGVSQRTFFNYFASKDLALLGPERELADSDALRVFRAGGPTGNLLPDLLDVINGPDPQDLVRSDLHQLLEVLDREPRALAAYLSRHNQLENRAAQLVAERLGLPGPDDRCRVAAALAFTVLRQAGRRWFHTDADAGSFLESRKDIQQLLAEILAPSAGLAVTS